MKFAEKNQVQEIKTYGSFIKWAVEEVKDSPITCYERWLEVWNFQGDNYILPSEDDTPVESLNIRW